MLIQLQKKLENTECPCCQHHHTLQASLLCSRDEAKCQNICQCTQCGTNFIIDLPENFSESELESSYVAIKCDLETSHCHLEFNLGPSVYSPSGLQRAG